MFVQFYAVYTVHGGVAGESGKKRQWFHDRSFAAGIEEAVKKLEQHFNTYGKAKVNKTTTRIYRKHLYAKRFKMRLELGLARTHNSIGDYLRKRRQSPTIFIRKTQAALV